MTVRRTGSAAIALTATLGLAAACWAVSVWQMTVMDMGVATRLGSLGFFAAAWLAMMAAMMLPGAAPAGLDLRAGELPLATAWQQPIAHPALPPAPPCLPTSAPAPVPAPT